MTIIAFLQNQWFRNPARAQRIMETRYKDREHEFVRDMLFLGCQTGRRLRLAFGEKRCSEIIWENVSPKIGGFASASFPPDPEHVARVLTKFKPEIVLALGSPAARYLQQVQAKLLFNENLFLFHLLCGPHPCARHLNPVLELKKMAAELDQLVCSK